MNPRIMLIIMGVLIVILGGILFYMLRQSRSAEKADLMIKAQKKRNTRNYLYHIYVIFTSVPVLKNYFQRIRNRIRIIYPADEISINTKATSMVLRALVVCFGVMIGVIFVAGGDIFFLLAGIMVTYVLFVMLTEKAVENTEEKLIQQLRLFIDSVREQYNRTGRVDDAIAFTLDGLPYEISLHATQIHAALISTDVTKSANDYVANAPNKFFMTFMAICALTVDNGDKRLDNGESLFLKNLNFLKEEINTELIRMQKLNAMFSGYSLMTLSPILAIKPIESWAMGNLPEMAEIYKGSYGIICMSLIFLISAVCYTIINNLKVDKSDSSKETSVFRTLSEFRPVRRFINGIVTRNYTKALRWNDMLRFTGDRQGVNTFITKRFVVAILVYIGVIALITGSTISDKKKQMEDFSMLFDTSMVESQETRETMEAAAEDIAKTLVADKTDVTKPDYEKELAEQIMQQTDIKNATLATMVASAVIKRVTKYNSIYFKWYYLFIALIGAIVGYYIPLGMLMFKYRSVQMTLEDEVNQFQTIILMLIHVDGINTVTILEWLERFAFCFKDSISQCIIDLPHKGQEALENMQDRESFPAFQSLVNSMLAIDDVGVETAFSNIEIDREYYKEKRKEDNEEMMERKGSIAKFIAFIPVIFVVGAYLIYPLVNMAMSMMNEINQAM